MAKMMIRGGDLDLVEFEFTPSPRVRRSIPWT